MIICNTCGNKMVELGMIEDECFLCVLGKYPPEGEKQIAKFKKALGFRLRISTPLNSAEQAARVVDALGIEDYELYEKVISGDIIDHAPVTTFYRRILKYLEDRSK